MTAATYSNESARSYAESYASFSDVGFSVAIGWSTFFQRPLLKRIRYPRLRYAYRAPAYVLERLATHGCRLTSLQFDERLTGAAIDKQLVGVDLLYLSTHGGQGPQGYETALTNEEWRIVASQLGHGGPRVVVFDTCDLVDRRSADWRTFWMRGAVGPHLRLVLGFSSQATVSPETSRRGDAFAQLLLAGEPVARAWLRATANTGWRGLDRPVAIALGDTPQEARWIATAATMDSLPGLRTADTPFVHALPERDQG